MYQLKKPQEGLPNDRGDTMEWQEGVINAKTKNNMFQKGSRS